MLSVGNKFGLRRNPSWAKDDFESHLRLCNELELALKLVPKHTRVKVPPEMRDIGWDQEFFKTLSRREQMQYFTLFAVRLQRTYHWLMEALAPYAQAQITTLEHGYKIRLRIEDKEYPCSYLTDHVCCLVWVVGKITFHIENFTTKRK